MFHWIFDLSKIFLDLMPVIRVSFGLIVSWTFLATWLLNHKRLPCLPTEKGTKPECRFATERNACFME